ncbi:unnamed protein product [Blepharisma stoltei]|uniref:Cyclic nucleotide-binding domain-containing protein n=1 Tax=Blepharisma stoltei TaxID=1481888 RepID=A0AAU9J4Z9_9CILI|nr:unnamed protein product [Blepharisma stoltei]
MSNFPAEIILFIFMSILFTVASYEIKKRFYVPVSPCLLVFGTLARVIGTYFGDLGPTVSLLDDLDPVIVQLAVMPALIFEASLGTDWYTFKKIFWQILPMATTVVCLTSFLTACVLKYMMTYDFGWNESLMLGVILNATDHVAVMAMLKELRANDRFETLLGGETLLNEATVVVFFNICLDSAVGEVKVSDRFVSFFQLTLGGLGLGLGFSLALAWSIKRIVNDMSQEINLTVVTAYVLFWLADHKAGCSGALAVVTLGLFMSSYGKTLISPLVEKSLHDFWHITGVNMEAIVFILAGMLLGMLIADTNNLGINEVSMLLALFVLLHIVRGIVVWIHFPILKRLGYGLSIKEAFIMTIAGIKGVIATALALIGYHHSDLNERFRSLLLFFTIGTVGLTILVDSFAVKFFVRKFGMDTLSEVQENMMLGVTTAVLQQTAKKVERIRSLKEFNLVKWDEVMNLAGPKCLLNQIMKQTKVGKKLLKKYPHDTPEELLEKYVKKFNLTTSVLTTETRRRFFTTLKGIYWHEFEAGQCLGYTVLILIDSCNQALDVENSAMCDWEILEKEIYNPKLMNFLRISSKIPIIGRLFKYILYERITLTYDAASTFIKSHEEAQELIDQMEIDIDELIFHEVMKESHIQIESCKEFIGTHITENYPEVIAEVQSKMASHTLLLSQRKLISKIYHQGVIKKVEYDHLLTAIDHNMKRLTFQSTPHVPSIKEMLKNRFRKAKAKDIEQLLPYIEEKHFQPDVMLFEEGQPINGAYLIFNGRVREFGNCINKELSIGNIAGVHHLLVNCRGNTTTAVTLSVVYAALIPPWISEKHVFMEDLYKEAAEEVLLLNKAKLGLEEAKNEHICRVAQRSIVRHVHEGSFIDLRRGALVLWGRVKKDKEEFSLLPPTKKIIQSADEAIVMLFPAHFGGILKQHKSISAAFASYYIRSASKNVNLNIKNPASDELQGLNTTLKLQKREVLRTKTDEEKD